MALNDIKFIRQEGGLGRPLPGKDHLSGMLFYTAGSLPSGFSSSDRIKKIFSLPEAEALGIVDDQSDETKGTGGKVVIAGTWTIGEISTIKIDDGVLATYTSQATTIADQVAGLVAAINAGTTVGIKHGWSATDVGGTDIILTQPDKLGVANNGGTHITFAVDSGSGTGTPTQFSGGVGSYFALLHYNIAQYFAQQPSGVLTVGIFAQAAFDGTEVETIQNFADGELRQLGIYLSHEAFATSQLNIIQDKVDVIETEHKPLSVVLHSNLNGATLGNLADLRTLSNKNVSMLIGEEGDYHQLPYVNNKSYLASDKVTFQGKAYISKENSTGVDPWDASSWRELRENLFAISGFSIGTMGTALGVISQSSVHENIGWVAKFNLVIGTVLDEIAFATGDLFNAISTSLKDNLDDFHYIFLRDHQGDDGTYFNDSNTAITATSDFATIENNRTIDKAVRNIRTALLPNLNGPLFVNADGTLSENTIALFKNDALAPLLQMELDGEISANPTVTIDPAQNVLSTSKVIISGKIIPVGVTREIEFFIGFTVNTTT